jgi:hypothetical protein
MFARQESWTSDGGSRTVDKGFIEVPENSGY